MKTDGQSLNERQKTIALDAKNNICAPCNEKLNKRLSRTSFLRGYSFVERIVFDTVCADCRQKILDARKNVEAAR